MPTDEQSSEKPVTHTFSLTGCKISRLHSSRQHVSSYLTNCNQKTEKTSDRICKCSLVAFNEQVRKQGANAHLGNNHDMNWEQGANAHFCRTTAITSRGKVFITRHSLTLPARPPQASSLL